MQTHRRTISSGRIQTYRIKTICLLLSPPATRTHEGVRVFGWVRECLGLLKSACSDSPSEVNVPIHNSYAPLKHANFLYISFGRGYISFGGKPEE